MGNEELECAHVVMCGPSSLIKAIRPKLRRHGARQIHVEAFDIRTGIGPDLSVDIERIVNDLHQRWNERRNNYVTKV